MLGEFQLGSETYYLLGLDVLGQQQGSVWSYFGYDALGSVRQITNSTGTVGYSANYDPYGNPLEQFGTLTTNLGFTGEYTDPSGLQYLRARYANPSTGTFISRDPFEGYMMRAMSRNGYSYVEGNPVNIIAGSCVKDFNGFPSVRKRQKRNGEIGEKFCKFVIFTFPFLRKSGK